MSETAQQEPDRVDGAPHPRDTPCLIGHAAAEAAFLDAHRGGRRHHAWLITGPRGIGKATLAWRMARFLLAEIPGGAPVDSGLFGAPPPAESLDVAADHPVARRVAAGSEPRLFPVRRAWDDKLKRLKTVITVDEVRRLKSFFALSAAEGGHRVALVDAADEMNASAANALLKLLEEPPAEVTLLLVAHRPARLLPTILSRCRLLRLAPLAAPDMAAALTQAGHPPGDNAEALAILSGGAVGEALRLLEGDGLGLYAELIGLLAARPGPSRPRALALAESVAGRAAEPRLDLALRLIDLLLARLARAGVAGPPPTEAAPGEADLLARFAPDETAARSWAEAAQTLSGRASHARAVNLDPAALVLDTLLKIGETGARVAAR